MASTFIIFVLCTVAVAFISWLKTRNDKTDTAEGYFLAGRGLTGIVICGSMVLTNISAKELAGTNGEAYLGDMSVMGWAVSVPLALILLALVFLPKYLEHGISTIPQFIAKRYDNKLRSVAAILNVAGDTLVSIPIALYAGSIVIEEIFDVSGLLGISYFASVALICVVTGVIGALYAITGGLKAVAISDTLNGVLLLLFCAIIVPVLAFIFLGDGSLTQGLHTFATATPEKLNAWAPFDAMPPSIPMFIACTVMIFNNTSFWCGNQFIVQRTLAAKDLANAQKGVLFTGLCTIGYTLFIVIPGIIGFQLYGPGQNPQSVYAMLINDVLPDALLGFFLAALVGAVLSTFNSTLNSVCTVFSLDIYKPLINPEISDKKLVRVSRIFGTIIAIVSICAAPMVMFVGSNIISFVGSTSNYYAYPLSIIVFAGLLSKKVSTFAAKCVIPAHIVCYVLFSNLLANYHFLYATGLAMVVDVIVLLAVSKWKPCEVQVETNEQTGHYIDMTPWKYRKPFAVFIFVLMIAMYLIFSPFCLGA